MGRGAGGPRYSRAAQHADEGRNAESFGVVPMCCEPVGAEIATDWKYVGHGRGGYEKVQNYQFVGQGSGNFIKEEIVDYQPTLRPRNECICLMLAVLIMSIIWMGPRLWGPGSMAESTEQVLVPLGGSQSDTQQDIEGSLVVLNITHEEVGNDTAPDGSLAASLRRAIAIEAGLLIQPNQVNVSLFQAAAESTNIEFVIQAVPTDRIESVTSRLSQTSRVEVGIASQLAEEASLQATALGAIGVRNFSLRSSAESMTSTNTTVAISYDCEADYTECEECLRKSWSPGKLEWCCDHRARGCEGATSSVAYDCNEGYDNWELGWSTAKKDMCCVSYGKGCESSSRSA